MAKGRKLRSLDAGGGRERMQQRVQESWRTRAHTYGKLPWRIADRLRAAGLDVTRNTSVWDCDPVVYVIARTLVPWVEADRDAVLVDLLDAGEGLHGDERLSAIQAQAMFKWGAPIAAVDPENRAYPGRDPETGDKYDEDDCDDYGVYQGAR